MPDFYTNTVHIIEYIWDKPIYSTLLYVSSLQAHLYAEQLILVEITPADPSGRAV